LRGKNERERSGFEFFDVARVAGERGDGRKEREVIGALLGIVLEIV